MPTSVIIDNFLSNENLKFLQNILKEDKETIVDNHWYDIIEDHKHSLLCHVLIRAAAQYYDIADIIGYEMWAHFNTLPPGGWHYDKDEVLFRKHKIYKFPVCSIVFYPTIKNLIGGELLLEKDITINPKENRLVLFKPKIFHNVNQYEGTRHSIVLNLWTSKPGSIIDNNV